MEYNRASESKASLGIVLAKTERVMSSIGKEGPVSVRYRCINLASRSRRCFDSGASSSSMSTMSTDDMGDCLSEPLSEVLASLVRGRDEDAGDDSLLFPFRGSRS